MNKAEIERVIELTTLKATYLGSILILLDEDYHCPFYIGPKILKAAVESRGDFAIGVVLAKQEFESWFLASAESLGGKCDLKSNLTSPVNFEGIRDAKGWLSNQMANQMKYKPRIHQAQFSEIIDMQLARSRSDSFDKFYREVTRLIDTLIKGGKTDA